jgi:dTDP-4-amino-4,6-dideoxygalactose transaminase
MMEIPLFRVPMNDDVSMVTDVLRSGYIGQGPKVEEFEGLLKNHFNASPI